MMDPERTGPPPEHEPPRASGGMRGMDQEVGPPKPPGAAPPASSPPPPTSPPRAAAPPPPAPPPPVPPKPKSGNSGFLGLALVAALVVGGWFYLSPGSGGAGQQQTSSSVSTTLSKDEVSPAFQKHKNASPDSAVTLTSAELNQAATDAAVQAAKNGQAIPGLSSVSEELRASIEKGEVTFYTIRAFDTCDEDGDWVTIAFDNGGKAGSFVLTNAGTTITVPVVNGQMPNVQLIADRDGAGGVTVGVQTSGGVWYSGVLAPGGMQQIPLAVR